MALTYQKAKNWNAAQKAWLQKNDPKKYAKGMSLLKQGGGGAQQPQTKTVYGRTFTTNRGGQAPQQPQGGGKPMGGGGGLIQGRQGGPQQAFGAGAPTMRGSKKGGLAGAMLGGAGGYFGSQLAAAKGGAMTGKVLSGFAGMGKGILGKGILGKLGPAGGLAGPVGWGLAGAALGAAILGSKKSNKQFEGTIQTGGAQGFQQGGGQMAQVKEGYIPTADEFVQHGRWLMPQDEYAHDYGRTFGESDRKYYDNFKKAVEGARNPAERKAILAAHGFATPQKQAAPVHHGGGGGAPAIMAMPEPVAVPKPTQKQKEEVSPPGSGLEDTIIAPRDVVPEKRRRTYLKARNAKKKKEEDEATVLPSGSVLGA